MADYAIHDTTLYGISNVIRKKDGTSALIDPVDYVEKINLMGMLPEKSASGAIAHFDDGADDVPIKSWGVTLPASLSGYSSVDAVHCGTNCWDEQTEIGGLNTTTGADTALSDRIRSKNYISVKPNTTYYVYNGTDIASSSNINTVWLCYGADKTYLGSYYYKNKTQPNLVTPSDCYYVRFYAVNTYGTTYNNDIALNYPSTVTTYAPYSATTVSTVSLGRTINGGSVDLVNGTGTDENGDDFTFTPISVNSRYGVNNLWTDNGSDNQIEYRADIGLALGYNKYRYLKWVITATRTTSQYVQMSDIEFADSNGNAFTFPSSTTVTASATATSGTGAQYIVDGNTSTKYCGNWASSGVTLTIDLGMTKTVDVSVYNNFKWYTANDANDRDPYTWSLYGIDASGTEILLASRTAYAVTTDRKALADTVAMNLV